MRFAGGAGPDAATRRREPSSWWRWGRGHGRRDHAGATLLRRAGELGVAGPATSHLLEGLRALPRAVPGQARPAVTAAVIHVLCAYLREVTEHTPDTDRAATQLLLEQLVGATHRGETSGGHDGQPGVRLNLAGAHLHNLDLAGAALAGVDLNGATCTGHTTLAAVTTDGALTAAHAVFSGDLDLCDVHVAGVLSLVDATIRGDLLLTGATAQQAFLGFVVCAGTLNIADTQFDRFRTDSMRCARTAAARGASATRGGSW